MAGSIEAKRWRRRIWRRIAYIVGHLRGYQIIISHDLQRLIDSQHLQGNSSRPVVLVSFHTSGMYGLFQLAAKTRPILCLVTKESLRFLRWLPWRPRSVRLASEMLPADLRRLAAAQEYLLVLADVNTAHSKLVHVPVFSRARPFSVSWALVAKSLGARLVAVSSIRDGRFIKLDGIELSTEHSPARIADAAFRFLQSKIDTVEEWDMVVSHEIYPELREDGKEDAGYLALLAASEPAILRKVAEIFPGSGPAETQDAVHAAKAEAV